MKNLPFVPPFPTDSMSVQIREMVVQYTTLLIDLLMLLVYLLFLAVSRLSRVSLLCICKVQLPSFKARNLKRSIKTAKTLPL
jgi:hypothetical protein